MLKHRLGNTDIEVTPVTFGAWAIGGWMWGGADENDALDAVRTAYDLGITTIDTAPVYGFGKSEELIGQALDGVPRDRYQLLTKFGMNWESEDGEFHFDTQDNEGNPVKMYKWAAPEKVKKECEDSLRRLKTDYIDLYQIHWPDSTTPVAETMETLNDLIKEGKIRAAGVCNFPVELVDEALKHIQLTSNQVPYSLIHRAIEKDVLPQAIENGMHILPYSPLQRGLLTGKIKPGHTFSEGDTRQGSKYYTDENIRKTHQLLDDIRPIAEKYNATLPQVIINWTSRQEGMGTVLVGGRNPEQVKDNAGALNFELTREELASIRQAGEEYFPLD